MKYILFPEVKMVNTLEDAKVGNLIKMTDPVWDWIKKGDLGIIVKVKEWENSCVEPRDLRYIYKVRFSNGKERIINRKEFEILS
jgi:hypothetical protein